MARWLFCNLACAAFFDSRSAFRTTSVQVARPAAGAVSDGSDCAGAVGWRSLTGSNCAGAHSSRNIYADPAQDMLGLAQHIMHRPLLHKRNEGDSWPCVGFLALNGFAKTSECSVSWSRREVKECDASGKRIRGLCSSLPVLLLLRSATTSTPFTSPLSPSDLPYLPLLPPLPPLEGDSRAVSR